MAIPTITCDELKRKLENGERLVMVHGLPPMSLAQSHIHGAKKMPPERVDAKRIPDQDAEIVVYCANPECESSVETANRLLALGFTNVRHYPGGKNEWRELGLPLERAGKLLE